MKNLIYSPWVHPLKILLGATVISATIINPIAGEVWASPQPQTIAIAVQTLKKSNQRWIQIDLSKQNLIAWEGDQPVYAVKISSGKRSTPTHIGTFNIQTKSRKTRMKGRGYDVPNVPYTMYYEGGYAIHGAYWHNRFGRPVSHGCVNLAPNHAKWVFNWADVGTPIVIQR